MSNDFSRTFNHRLAASGKSLTKVAALSGIDRAYLLRLSRGEKTRPTPETVVKLFIGLVFDEALVAGDPTWPQALAELLLDAATVATAQAITEG